MSRFEYTEFVDVKKSLAVLALTQCKLKDSFSDKDEGTFDSSHSMNVKKYLREAVASKGEMKREYRYAKDQTAGRTYVVGWGLQSTKRSLRNYVCGEVYYDIDMVNAHPSILLSLCIKCGISTPLLEEYVHNRDVTLESNGLSKKDILIAMNSDKPKLKKNHYYNSLVYELGVTKDALLDSIGSDVVTTNVANPISSRITKMLTLEENNILQRVVEYFGQHAHVPMFDGLMVHKDFCPEDALPSHIEELNAMFHDEYHGLVRFVLKSTASDVVLEERATEADEYDTVKVRFEEDHFLTLNPYVFWKKTRDSDRSYSFNQLKEAEFRNVCKEYQVTEFRDNGTMYTRSIFEPWMEDESKRKYECMDFIPFGRENRCPSFVYNTFEGFEINKVTAHKPRDTSNFDTLLNNLCNEDVEMTQYIYKYIAHMFQHPDVRTQKLVVFKSWTGCGKDTLFRTLQYLMGSKYVDITENPDHLFGNFNGIMDSKIALFMNELEGKDGIAYQERMKGQCTAIKNKVNTKHCKMMVQTNYCRLFVNSNNDGCVNVQVSDRRFVIIKSGFGLVANTKDEAKAKRVKEFWDRYYADLEDVHWRRSLYERLMDVDLNGYDPGADPGTQERELMRAKNINPLHYYLQDLIMNRRYEMFIEKEIQGQLLHLIKWKDFSSQYRAWLQTNHEPEFKVKDTTLKQKLANMDNCFLVGKKVQYKCSQSGMTKREIFSCFNMKEITRFLENYVFHDDNSEEHFDVGDVKLPKPPLPSPFAPGFDPCSGGSSGITRV